MIKFLRQKNIKNTSFFSKRGFTLVEALVSIFIFSVSILALIGVLSKGISNTEYAKKKLIASYLAQEGIEYIRNMRDTYTLYTGSTTYNWAQFVAKLAPCNSGNQCGINTAVAQTSAGSIFLCASHASLCKLYTNSTNNGYFVSGTVDSTFTRKIWVNTSISNEVKIYSIISYNSGGINYSTTLTDNLFNWVE